MSEDQKHTYDPRAEADALLEANNATKLAMARQGTPIPDAAILATWIDALTEHVMGPIYYDGPDGERVVNMVRAEYDCALQRKMSHNLEEWKSQIRQATLLHGVPRT